MSTRTSTRTQARARMPAVRAGIVHTVVALLVGAVAAVAALPLLDAVRESRRPDGFSALTEKRSDRVEEATAALLEDGVHVPPDGRGLLDEEGEARIEAAVAAAEVPVFVIVWADQQENGVWSPDLSEAIVAGLGVDRGTLIVWQGPQLGDTEEFGGSTFVSVSVSDFVGDPGETLPPVIAELGDPDDWYESGEFDYWGGVGGGIAAGALFAVGALLALGVLNLVLRVALGRWLLPGRWRWSDEPAAQTRDDARG